MVSPQRSRPLVFLSALIVFLSLGVCCQGRSDAAGASARRASSTSPPPLVRGLEIRGGWREKSKKITSTPAKTTRISTKKIVQGLTGGEETLASFKVLLLVFMVLQNSSTALVGKHTRSAANKEDLYVVNHLILIIECAKFVLSCILEYRATDGKLMQSIKENIFDRPMEFLPILVPSLLYLVQNSILIVALSNLSAPMFQVTYQLKLLTTALVSVALLKRSYSPKQWVCLTTLGFGVAIVVLDENKAKVEAAAATLETDKPHQSLFVGLLAVSIACLSSALAGVTLEKVLKDPEKDVDDERPPASLWMRNIQIAFLSICIASTKLFVSRRDDDAKPFMHGFTKWVYVLVALQAGGGLLVAAVIKYADNVLKGLATGVSVVVATIGSMVLFGTPLTLQFTVGAIIILSSVYLFSNDPPALPAKNSDKKR